MKPRFLSYTSNLHSLTRFSFSVYTLFSSIYWPIEYFSWKIILCAVFLLQPCLCQPTWSCQEVWPEPLPSVLQRVLCRHWIQEGKTVKLIFLHINIEQLIKSIFYFCSWIKLLPWEYFNASAFTSGFWINILGLNPF